MSVNYTDFDKIWASTSPLTPYEFSESQYKEGWNFVGNTPPSRQMWDKFMQQADEKMQYLYNHESVPVGHEYFTFNPNIPQGSLPLFGGEYSRETYSALWNWVQEQTGYLKTEAEWQTISASNNGNVPYYSDGDGSTTFRVPSLKCWVKGANGTVSEVGSYLAAGLPNITGTFRIRGDNYGSQIILANLAFSKQDAGDIGRLGTSGTGASTDIMFDASSSNSIYGNSSTVQPPSIVGMWLVKAYGVVEETGSIDEQAYIDDRFNASKQYTDDKVAPIGTLVQDATTTSVSVSKYAYPCSVTLSKGVWVIDGTIRYSSIIAGRMFVGITVGSETISTDSEGTNVSCCSTEINNPLTLTTSRIVNVTNNSAVVYLAAFSDVESTLTRGFLKAVRII